jgi:DNA-binding transcriptional regulator LsrR (DeoR family)
MPKATMTKDERHAWLTQLAALYSTGMKYKDIAAIMGLTTTQVCAWIQSARNKGLIKEQRYTVIPGARVQSWDTQRRIQDGYEYTDDHQQYALWESYYWSNLTIKQIAEVFGVSIAVINYRHRELKRKGYVPRDANRTRWILALVKSKKS